MRGDTAAGSGFDMWYTSGASFSCLGHSHKPSSPSPSPGGCIHHGLTACMCLSADHKATGESDAASIHNCKMRNAQNTLTEEGLQQREHPHLRWRRNVHTRLCQCGDSWTREKGRAQSTRYNALQSKLRKGVMYIAAPHGTGNTELSGSGPQPRL